MPTSRGILEEDIRFGLPAKRTTYDGKGVFKFKSNDPIECIMVFKNETRALQAQCMATFYTPRGFFPNETIPERYIKYRIEFDVGELIIRPYTNKTSGILNFEKIKKIQPFDEHKNIWRVAKILNLSQTEDCTIELWKEGEKLLGPASISVESSSFGSEVLDIIQIVEDAWFLVKMLEVSPDTIINIDQILAQKDDFWFLRQLCDVNVPIDSFTGSITAEEQPDKEMVVPFVRKIFFGGLAYVVKTGVAGQPIVTLLDEPNSYVIRIDNLRRVYLEHSVVQKDSGLSKDEVVDDLIAKLEDKGFDVLIGP